MARAATDSLTPLTLLVSVPGCGDGQGDVLAPTEADLVGPWISRTVRVAPTMVPRSS